DPEKIQPAAEAWIRLRTAKLKEPFTAGQVEEAARLVRSFEAMLLWARDGAPGKLLADRLSAWSKQLGDRTVEDLEASGRLLELASRFALSSERKALVAARTERRIGVARLLADDWPVEALGQWSELGAEAAALEGIAALEARVASDELLLEAKEGLERWFKAVAQRPEAASLV
ncbi:MAG: hypothetical protein HY901_16360, partial [Deltaproteobacteria bacterium]|nr:hypothetical protein [Deltaproteobacteria bacterium]